MSSAWKEALPLGLRKTVKARRAKAFERVGSLKYSAPALSRLDLRMAEKLPTSGVFLEIGANDGYSQSNTYYLARARDWKGILIEPSPTLFERCRRMRPEAHCVRAACVATATEGDLVQLVDLDLQSVTLGQQASSEEARRLAQPGGRPYSVPAKTLSSVIDASPYDHVNFMSIDVEGAELSVLAGLDLARHCPDWLLVETAHPEAVSELLAPHATLHERMTGHDYLFARS
jgi:FkbM family methyltransferase